MDRAESLLRPVAGVVRALTALSSIDLTADAPAAADAPIPIAPAAPPDAPGPIADASAAADWKDIVYLGMLAALVGLLTFTIWKEMGPALRAGMR